MLLSASMQFVVRKLRFRAGSIPSLWSVRVSSRPSSRLARADAFISLSSGLRAFSAAFAAS